MCNIILRENWEKEPPRNRIYKKTNLVAADEREGCNKNTSLNQKYKRIQPPELKKPNSKKSKEKKKKKKRTHPNPNIQTNKQTKLRE